MAAFSDYIVYVDESGDHSLRSIDEHYPIFVLAFCIFRKSEYSAAASRDLQDFKFRWFGHDSHVLHESDIVKRRYPFAFLDYDNIRERFMNDLSAVLEATSMTVITAVIKKDALRQKYERPENPYQIALFSCLERTQEFFRCQENDDRECHIICESRSPREKAGQGKEDRELEVEFRRIIAGQHFRQEHGSTMSNFSIAFVSKQANSAGLQLADLIARPIGLHVLRESQQNRAFDIIRPKIWKGPTDSSLSYGMKLFP